VEYLQNLRALANRTDNTGQLANYLGQAGLLIRPVTLGPTDWHGIGAGTTKTKAAPLNPSGGTVGDIDKARQGIKDAANAVEQAFEVFDRTIATKTAEKWLGSAAQAAADAISGYIRDSYAMVEAGYATAVQYDSLYNSMTTTFQKLPDRPHLGAGNVARNVVEVWHWTDSTTAQSRADTAASGEAERVMNSIYYGNDPGQNVSGAGITAVAASLPVFPAPSSPVVSQDGSTGGLTSSGLGGGPAGSGLPGAGVPQGGQPNLGDTNNGQNANGNGGNANGLGNHAGGGTPAGNGQGHQGGAAGLPHDGDNALGAASADPGAGLGGGGDGGLGGGDGGDSSLASPSLGGGLAAGTRAPGGSAGPAGRGASGMPGMGMPGGRGRKGEDKEHKSADYLRGNHLQEIFETVDGRRVAPPVLGVWDEESKESPEQ
jgi:hypothetical protein